MEKNGSEMLWRGRTRMSIALARIRQEWQKEASLRRSEGNEKTGVEKSSIGEGKAKISSEGNESLWRREALKRRERQRQSEARRGKE